MTITIMMITTSPPFSKTPWRGSMAPPGDGRRRHSMGEPDQTACICMHMHACTCTHFCCYLFFIRIFAFLLLFAFYSHCIALIIIIIIIIIVIIIIIIHYLPLFALHCTYSLFIRICTHMHTRAYVFMHSVAARQASTHACTCTQAQGRQTLPTS